MVSEAPPFSASMGSIAPPNLQCIHGTKQSIYVILYYMLYNRKQIPGGSASENHL